MAAFGRPRLKAALILGATFLLGLVLGSLIVGAVVRERLQAIADFRDRDRFVARVEAFLEPTSDSQAEAIRPILEAAGARTESAFVVLRGDLTRIFDDLERELAPLLTEEQRQRLSDRRVLLRQRADRDSE